MTRPGSKCAGWSGACTGMQSSCSVTLSADTAVGASFTAVPNIFVSPALVFFKTITIGRNAAQQFTIANKGLTPLTVIDITIDGADSGEFTETDTCSSTIDPSGTCSMRFYSPPLLPVSSQPVLHITIPSNDPASPNLYIALSGGVAGAVTGYARQSPGDLGRKDNVVSDLVVSSKGKYGFDRMQESQTSKICQQHTKKPPISGRFFISL
jgi:hypothetical protein